MDDKKNIGLVMRLLEEFKNQIDEQITKYQTAEVKFEVAEIEGNSGDMRTNQDAMKAARDAILSKLAGIDRLIFEQSEGKVTDSLGVKDPANVTARDLNQKIAEILEKVKSAKDLGMKTDDGKDVELKFKTADTLEKLEELDATKKTRDYSKIDQDIADLEAVAIDEELLKKFNEVKGKISARDSVALDDVEVATVYKKEIAGIEKKLAEYKALADLKSFDSKQFSSIRLLDTFTNTANKPKAEQWFNLLKTARGNQTVTIGKDTFEIGSLKDAEAFFAKFKGLSEKDFKKAIASLAAVSRVSDDELKTKSGEVKSTVSSSLTMELFAEDKTKIDAILGTNPVDIAKLTTLLKDMKDPDKENFAALEKLSGDPAEIAKARQELEHLKKIKAAMDKEAGIKVEAQEIDKLKFGKDGKLEVELKRGSGYTGKFVDAEGADLEEVVEATYEGLDSKVRESFEKAVIRDAEMGDDKLPRHIFLFSKLAAAFRGETMTTREKAIAKRVKDKLSKKLETTQIASREGAAAVESDRKQEAENEKNDLFRVDQETIDRIDAAARKFIIAQQGQTTVEEARDQAARDEEK